MLVWRLVTGLLISGGLGGTLSAPALTVEAGSPPHRLLALGAAGKGAVRPPKNIPTVTHDKEKGSGYMEGSPLYEKQEAIKAAGPVDPAPAPVSTGGWSWWWWVAVAVLVLGILCVGGGAFYYKAQHYMTERHEMPPPALPAPALDRHVSPSTMSAASAPKDVSPSGHRQVSPVMQGLST